MIRRLVLAALLSTGLAAAPVALADEDELVRLPGKGELRAPKPDAKKKPTRLKPGGGLFISFDTDQNGAVSHDELTAGIPDAFGTADDNGDGYLTALEQQAWAGNLPTRDDSLANPVRFDPNLDRRVSLDEFSSVITELAADYTADGEAVIVLADLEAPAIDEERAERIERAFPEGAPQRRRGERQISSR